MFARLVLHGPVIIESVVVCIKLCGVPQIVSKYCEGHPIKGNIPANVDRKQRNPYPHTVLLSKSSTTIKFREASARNLKIDTVGFRIFEGFIALLVWVWHLHRRAGSGGMRVFVLVFSMVVLNAFEREKHHVRYDGCTETRS